MKLINAYEDKRAEQIVLKYRNGNEIEYRKIPKFENYFFIKNPAGNYEYVLDNTIKCSKIKSRDNAQFENDTSLLDRFCINEIEDLFEELEYKDLKFMFYDIETYASLDINAEKPILSISFSNNFSDKTIVLIWRDDFKDTIEEKDDLEIYKFSSEQKMLEYCIQEMKKVDVIVGFNSSKFDDLYFANRCDKLGIFKKFKIFNSARIFKRENNRQNLYSDFVFYDARTYLVNLFSRASDIEKPSSFSLNELSRIILNDIKLQNVNIVESWKNDYIILCKYVSQDVKLLKRLCEKTKILDAFVDRLNFTKVYLGKVNVNSYVIDILIRRMYRNKVFPSKTKYDESFEQDKLYGAIVLKPIEGVYTNVGVLDFSSMYPNTILAYNISPDKQGEILPSLIRHLMNLRYKYKALQKTAKSISEKQIYKANEMIVKDLINSCYGVFGYSKFRLFDLDVANKITRKSREILMATSKFVKEKLKCAVLAGDTDSLFVKLPRDKVDDYVEQINSYLKKEFSEIYSLDCETFFKLLFLPKAKKTYIGLVDTVKGRSTGNLELYAKGFSLVRRDTPTFFKDILNVKTKELFKDILKNKNTYNKMIRDIEVELLNETDVRRLLISKQISREIDDYKVKPQHVRAMQFSNRQLGTNFNRLNYSGGMLFVKDKLTDVIMLDFDNTQEIENGEIKINGQKFKIDYKKYLELFVLSKFNLLNDDLFKLDIEQQSLQDFFTKESEVESALYN